MTDEASDTVALQDVSIRSFVASHDAQIKHAESAAGIAEKLANTAVAAGKGGEEILALRLGNVAKLLDIRWDSQSHESLMKAREKALRRVRELQAERIRVADYANRIGALLTGGSWAAVRDAWIAFSYFYTIHAPRAVFAEVPPGAYSRAAWLHPSATGAGVFCEPAHDIESHNPPNLLRWARIDTLFPVEGTAAFTWLQGKIAALADSAAKMGGELGTLADKAAAELSEIEKTDWARLKP